MSRKIYMQELEEEARHQARNARLAFATKADAGTAQSPTKRRPVENDLMEVLEQGRAAFEKLREIALYPFHVAVSKPAQKAYLGTFLLATTSLFLLAVSTVAYALFYYNFVPQVSVERTIHLQFGNGHPHGTATLGSSLASLQPYDVSLLLHLPRTPNNLAAGNFMLDLSLLAAPGSPSVPNIPTTTASVLGTTQQKLANSRRPAILTYASLITDMANTLSGLPWHMLGWKTESEVLEVAMFEGLEFPRGSRNVAQELELVVEADEKMQFYEVGVRIVARFGGLRWIMYYHRILSYVIFTSLFWTSSMISALIAWLVLALYFPSGSPLVKEEPTRSVIKREHSETEPYEPSLTEGLSDTSRTFPTLTRHTPLYFSSRGESSGRSDELVKEEEDVLQSTGVQPLIAEADDEGEGAETSGFRDSGIGTSLDEDRRAQVQRRRKALSGGRD
ncbi:MAG: hypothetical protein L6R35_001740 [Caloplaca aegaea]|nr:MAG: hypothetical protein L6R35_001740 [Caloplaca aegaea]